MGFTSTLLGIFRDDASTYVVSSFATEGDLFSWISKADGFGPEYQAPMKLIAFQLFCAIRWLHQLGISHGDLSLENIAVTNIGWGRPLLVQLIDFGLATSERVRWGTSGKKKYMAPEMHHGGYDTFMADNFALGVVLFSLASQDSPWLSTAPAQCKAYAYVREHGLRAMVRAKKCRKQRDTRLSQVLSGGVVDTIDGLICEVPDSRLTLGETAFHNKFSVWETPWVKDEVVPRSFQSERPTGRGAELETPPGQVAATC